jgi:hypothetical protein
MPIDTIGETRAKWAMVARPGYQPTPLPRFSPLAGLGGALVLHDFIFHKITV